MSRVRNDLTKTIESSKWIDFSIVSGDHIIPPPVCCSSIRSPATRTNKRFRLTSHGIWSHGKLSKNLSISSWAWLGDLCK